MLDQGHAQKFALYIRWKVSTQPDSGLTSITFIKGSQEPYVRDELELSAKES